MNGIPKVYMGRDGFKGVSRIGHSSYLEKMAGPQKKPMVYSGGAGVSIHKVLANGGIVGGGVVRVRPVTAAKSLYMGGRTAAKVETGERAALKAVKPRFPIIPPKTEKRLDEFSKTMAEKEMKFIEADVTRAERPEEAEIRKSMMEMAREPNLAAEVDRNPPKAVEAVGAYAPAEIEEAAIEPQTNPPTVEVTMEELPKYTGFSKGEWGVGGDTTSELPLGEGSLEGGKKRRKRKNRKPRASTEMPEAERAAIQAEIEAASDNAEEEQ